MKKKKILIFPAGTEIAFEIMNALKYSKFVDIYGGTSISDHSEFVFEKLIKGFPFIEEKGFLDYLNKIVSVYNIDCIYPAHDSVSVFLSEHATEINAQVIISDKKTTSICRSKRKTYNFFEKEEFIPRVYDDLLEITDYPVFVKPNVGQGSNGARKIETRIELERLIDIEKSLVICEYLPGEEFTVDCFTDGEGELLSVKIRTRERIRVGISVRSSCRESDAYVCNIAKVINERLSFKGAWFFQLKKNIKGEYRLLEISPRIPGTMGASRNQGINYPLLTLFVFWGYDVKILDNNYELVVDRAFYNAYKLNIEYEYVYVDFDDTIIIEDKVNEDIIKFLYQAVNKGKKLILLSKHINDIYKDLIKYKISKELFEEIIIIPKNKEKAMFIEHNNSIFIDDSFTERKKVFCAKKIPVFDVDMIECLIDWRK